MRTAAELQRVAWETLIERLGLADAIRYRALSEVGTGDYAREREQLFGGASLDELLGQARAEDSSKRDEH